MTKLPEIINNSSLDQVVHDSLTPWILDHSLRSGNLITDLGYDPSIFPYQRLSEAYAPAKVYPAWIPSRLILRGIERALIKNLGSKKKARDMVDTFLDMPAWDGANTSITEEVERRLENKETVGVLTDHMESGDLRDIALIMAGLIKAIGVPSLRQRSAILMGKNISRQAYKGRPIVEQATRVTGIIWVMQNTANRRRLGIPEAAVQKVNHGAIRALRQLSKKGALVGIVPSGTAMEQAHRADGSLKYIRPDVLPATIKLLGSLDALLPVAMYRGRVIPGPLYSSKPGDETPTIATSSQPPVEAALQSLAQHDADLSQATVSYNDSQGRSISLYPNQI